MAAAVVTPPSVAPPTVAGAVNPVATPPAPAGTYPNSSLYVGDLEANVIEAQLFDLFGQVGQVVSVRVCRDQEKRVSLGYAYVNYSNPQDAANAMEILNFTPVNGKPIRIMFSQRDPSIRKSGCANVFIKNLDASIDNKALHETFAAFGTVLSCKVAVDSNGHSKGYGYVQFEQEEAAQSSIKRLNGMLMNDKKVYVGNFVRLHERSQAKGLPKFTNVYVKNLSETTSDEDLSQMFGKLGPITSAVVMKDDNGKSKCFGFVNFQEPDDAAAAVEKLNGTSTSDGKILYVGRAQKKAEREAELRAKFEQERNSRFEKLQGANLYMKNLDESISDDQKLKELFSEFGTITSCKVILDQQGVSKGSGFVAFSSPEEATKALHEMNGKMVGRKPLYVAVAQRKEERRARLQAQFALARAPGPVAPLPAGMPGFHPRGPRLGSQPVYFGQGTPGMLPPQPGYGFQQPPFMPGVRPPNFMVPYQLQRQGQPGNRLGPRRPGSTQPMTQQVMHHGPNQGFRYMANGQSMVDQPMGPQAAMGNMAPLPLDGSVMPVTSTTDVQAIPAQTLASALASATPDTQRRMLGEQLYPLVERIEQTHAGKVTGMLLEMDQTEVLHLLEDTDALKKKVGEAMDVLRLAASGGPNVSDQLGSLSLDE